MFSAKFLFDPHEIRINLAITRRGVVALGLGAMALLRYVNSVAFSAIVLLLGRYVARDMALNPVTFCWFSSLSAVALSMWRYGVISTISILHKLVQKCHFFAKIHPFSSSFVLPSNFTLKT